MSLGQHLEPQRVSEREFILNIPEGWQQGRGAFGGLVLGGLVRCIELSEEDSTRTLRSLTAQLTAPVLVGPATVRVEPLRRGNAVSTVRATITKDDETLAEMVAVLGRSRPGTPTWQELTPPEMIPWREIEPAPIEPPIAPAFAQHFEFRLTGPIPYAGGDVPEASGWLRAKDRGESSSAALITAHADGWWPASAARFDGPRPTATITFTLEIVGKLDGLNPEAPFYHRARAPISDDGYSVEFRELWGEDGRLLALNQQTFAIIK